eukprot:s204_g21.t1
MSETLAEVEDGPLEVDRPIFGEDDGPEGSRLADVRRALNKGPMPSKPVEYDVEEAEFWLKRYLPSGSVLEFINPRDTSGDPPKVAVLVHKTVSTPSGIWVHVQFLGASTEEEKKQASKFFRTSTEQIHICNTRDGRCPEKDDVGLHLTKFTWFPPGDFTAAYLTSYGKKLVSKGKKMALEEDAAAKAREEEEEPGAEGKGRSAVEKRLSALRRRSGEPRRVTFADTTERPASQRPEDASRAAGAGIGGRARASSSLALVSPRDVKQEITVSDTTDSEGQSRKKKKKEKGQDLGKTLALVAKDRALKETPKERRRSRSRSRGRRRRRRKKRSSGSDSGSESSRRASSSEDSLIAPLKKRSQKTPGSVFQMLEATAVEKLSADGILEEGYEAGGEKGQRPKMLTFYQLCLKPHLDYRGRDCKELAVLARSLDLLRSGRLAELADVLDEGSYPDLAKLSNLS